MRGRSPRQSGRPGPPWVRRPLTGGSRAPHPPPIHEARPPPVRDGRRGAEHRAVRLQPTPVLWTMPLARSGPPLLPHRQVVTSGRPAPNRQQPSRRPRREDTVDMIPPPPRRDSHLPRPRRNRRADTPCLRSPSPRAGWFPDTTSARPPGPRGRIERHPTPRVPALPGKELRGRVHMPGRGSAPLLDLPKEGSAPRPGALTGHTRREVC